ncbi:hypothetical protein ACH42_12470 [Endozoicomonas sp. (ex Bugula neritina AB1)]|nr:hypothetical protein ACH42_12470 [Endozoicomonas sp. (ex Bugula neritina AB1)]
MTLATESIVPVAFDELADRMVELGGDGHPAEIHGYISGVLSAGGRPVMKTWLEQVAEQMGDKTLNDAMTEVLTRLYKSTLQQLEAGDFSIQVLLPDDDESLAQRTESLGTWCQSFISGFGQGLSQQNVSDMVEDVLKDFAEISLIEATEENEESEKLFVEVSEFVRMAWLAVFNDLHDKSEDDSSTAGKGSTIH